MANKKRYSRKIVSEILSVYEAKAMLLLGDSGKLSAFLEDLEQHINGPMSKYEKIHGAFRFIELIRDDIGQEYTEASSECIVQTLSALLCIKDNIVAFEKGHRSDELIPNDVLIRFINKGYEKELQDYSYWNRWLKPGIYPLAPRVIVDKKEEQSIEKLTKRYEKLLEPSKLGYVADKIKEKVPDKVKIMIEEAGHAISSLELYEKILAVAANGFDILVKQSSKVTLSEEYIVNKINDSFEDNHIFKLEQVCYARGYDISKLVNKFKTQNIYVALAEGGATGAAGLPGIPINLATSMFVYYRAVQSIAMYYGYDVKNDSDELELATEVFMQAMDPRQDSSSEMGSMITKFMAMTEAAVVKQTVKKGWAAMADRGGLCLLITQIRALAHKAAQKALQNAGKKGIEESMFTGVLELIGKQLSKEAVEKAATPAAALITALMDVSTMHKVVEFADIFYNKRFVLEKETRIDLLQHPEYVDDVEFSVVDELEMSEALE